MHKITRNGVTLEFVESPVRGGKQSFRAAKTYKATSILKFAGKEQAAEFTLARIHAIIDYCVGRGKPIEGVLQEMNCRYGNKTIPQLRKELAEAVKKGDLTLARELLSKIESRERK